MQDFVGHRSGQRVGGRSAEGHVQLELRLIEPDDRVEVIGPGFGCLPQAIEQFDRPAFQSAHPNEIFAHRVGPQLHGLRLEIDFGKAGLSTDVSVGNLLTNAIEDNQFLELRRTQPSTGRVD